MNNIKVGSYPLQEFLHSIFVFLKIKKILYHFINDKIFKIKVNIKLIYLFSFQN
jgi:hypothetical protein